MDTADKRPLDRPPRPTSVVAALDQLIEHSGGSSLSLNQLLTQLGDRGVALLAVVLSLPFIQPIVFPLLSVPFGLALAGCGWFTLRAHPVRLPRWLGERQLDHTSLLRLRDVARRVFGRIDRWFQPRLLGLVHPRVHRWHGCYLLGMAVVLSLPFPAVPFFGSNAIAAYPIFLLGLGLLERDGLFVALAYAWLIPFLAYWLFFYQAIIEAIAHLAPWLRSFT